MEAVLTMNRLLEFLGVLPNVARHGSRDNLQALLGAKLRSSDFLFSQVSGSKVA